jgi:hypothetical protein
LPALSDCFSKGQLQSQTNFQQDDVVSPSFRRDFPSPVYIEIFIVVMPERRSARSSAKKSNAMAGSYIGIQVVIHMLGGICEYCR